MIFFYEIINRSWFSCRIIIRNRFFYIENNQIMILSVLEKKQNMLFISHQQKQVLVFYLKSPIEFCNGSRFTQLFMELIYLYIVAISLLWFFNPATMPTSLFNSCLQCDWMIEIMYQVDSASQIYTLYIQYTHSHVHIKGMFQGHMYQNEIQQRLVTEWHLYLIASP